MKNFETYKIKFSEKAKKHGYSEDNIQKCLKYSEKLFQNNSPIIYNSYHLSALVGYKHSYLTRAILSTEFFYRDFVIKKKNNSKTRIISEPLPSLKEIQYFILKEILYKQKVSKFCKSYIPEKKFKEYLRYHVNKKEVLTLDIKNFFPSIKYNLILEYFTSLGYSKDISLYLSCLCTYSHKENKFNKFERFLPQGAPTSPYLSNLILKNFDDQISTFCIDKNINYTRYADDIVFSGENINKDEMENLVKNKLNFLGLELNKGKTNFMKQNTPQIISGVIVNKKMQLPKNERNEIRKIMYYIIKYGIENHLEKIKETRDNYIPHILGKIQYILNLNPKDSEFLRYKFFLLENKK